MSGIYIHIPFCKQACYYCDFHFSTTLKFKDKLVEALHKELILRKDELRNETVETIYFGGGTPSLLTAKALEQLIETIYKTYKISKQPEITIEVNPDDLSLTYLKALNSTKVNRLSIGIQSFFETHLQHMNRAHSAHEAKQCLKETSNYFNNISIDLIYGIPTMSQKQWKYNLEIAFNYNIQHISAYALTVEPKTALHSFIKKGKYPPIDEDLAWQHFNILVNETEAQQFLHYEISNFGRPDYLSKHNTSYWQGKPYLGIGPSAHSFNGLERSWNIANNIKYIEAIFNKELPSSTEKLTKKNCFNEQIMTKLRTIWGIRLDEIETQFGLDYKAHLSTHAQTYIDNGLLEYVNVNTKPNRQILKATKKGKFLIDGIASNLFMI